MPCDLFLTETHMNTWWLKAPGGCRPLRSGITPPRRAQPWSGRCNTEPWLSGKVLHFLLYGLQSIWTNGIMDFGFYVAFHYITRVVNGNKKDYGKMKANPADLFFFFSCTLLLIRRCLKLKLAQIFRDPFLPEIDMYSCIWTKLIQPFDCCTGRASYTWQSFINMDSS